MRANVVARLLRPAGSHYSETCRYGIRNPPGI